MLNLTVLEDAGSSYSCCNKNMGFTEDRPFTPWATWFLHYRSYVPLPLESMNSALMAFSGSSIWRACAWCALNAFTRCSAEACASILFLHFRLGKAPHCSHQHSSEQAKQNAVCKGIWKGENKIPAEFGNLHLHGKWEIFFQMAFWRYMLQASLHPI